MSDIPTVPTKDTKSLQEEAASWADAILARHGIRLLGPFSIIRERPWATVASALTSAGVVWLKAASPATAFEASLYPLLTRHAPRIVLSPLGIDEERGWMLLPHGGETLDTGRDGDALAEALVAIVPRYAEMQRQMAMHVDAMLAAGVPDLRPAALPDRFDEVLAYSRAFAAREGNEGWQEPLRRVEILRESVVEQAERLSSMVEAASIDHSDLHARNILVPPGEGVAAARVYDWGDSIVAHPFTSLLVLLRDLMNTLEAPLEDRRVQRVIDAYLEPFSDLAAHDELVETAMFACQVGKVTRAHAWLRSISTQAGRIDPDDASAPLAWLGELLSPNLLDLD